MAPGEVEEEEEEEEVEEDEEKEEEEKKKSVSPPVPKSPAPPPLPVRKNPTGERSVVGDPNAGSGSSSSGNPKVEQAFRPQGGPTLRGQATVTTPLLP